MHVEQELYKYLKWDRKISCALKRYEDQLEIFIGVHSCKSNEQILILDIGSSKNYSKTAMQLSNNHLSCLKFEMN